MHRILLVLLLALLSACTTQKSATPPVVKAEFHASSWSALPGWPGEQLSTSWSAWINSCTKIGNRAAWKTACADARTIDGNDSAAIRAFFESHFTPWHIETNTGAQDGLITGYYEAQLTGGLEPKPGRVPLYAAPDDLLTIDMSSLYPELKGLRLRGRVQGKTVVPYWSRADISSGKAAMQNAKVLAWADDPVDAFFLEVQGSGRVQLDNGESLRLGYADQNGYAYKSIGKWLVDQGEMPLDKASMQGIRAWGQAHPERLQDMLNANPSYVFFRPLPDDGKGPSGALNVPLTGEASIAVDPKFIPLGSPVYLATTRPYSSQPLLRLVHAQDTGGAIRGPIRADFFWGYGANATEMAGKMKQRGQLWLLWPNDQPLPSN
jgi:membrane-bound lytic murein transglycosylase A